MSRTKLFLFGYFSPTWLSALMMWGDDRTSSNFDAPPPWFYYAKFGAQILSILLLFLPLKLRRQPALLALALAIGVIAALSFAKPILEAEYILINSSIQICVLVLFLSIAQPNATLQESDIGFLFYMFLIGFVLQIFLFLGFGRMPAHTIEDVFVRFNGITNDSLSAGLILPVLIPWAINSGKKPELKTLAIIAEAVASGSLFSMVFVPPAVVLYLVYRRLYKFVAVIMLSVAVAAAYFSDVITRILEIKFQSILAHMRFFLNLSGTYYEQSTKDCSEEFCESFVESGFHLSPISVVLFFCMLIYFIIKFVRSRELRAQSPIVFDSLRVYGAALIVASLVHPIPLIPFGVPLFLILASLHIGRVGAVAEANRGQGGPDQGQRIPSW